jgi:hypothetical protein
MCLRWLGENAFLNLRVLPWVRGDRVGPEEVEYWIWRGAGELVMGEG